MIRTRIAPSPTGNLHLGTARTALFNYLYTKKNQGKIYLRIEDTDRVRSQKKYIDDIIAGLEFLGIDWDGEIIYQTQRLKIYQKYVDELIKKNLAYRADNAIWLKVSAVSVPEKIEFTDTIRGKISFPKSKIKDFVIVTSQQMPLFLLTNVIDDYEMKITDVIRGEDHISNTPRQILLQKAMGIPSPRYAHIPLILAPDKSKLSKRAGATAITDYQKQGFLAPALINFLALLGFHPQEDKDIYAMPELVKKFDLKRVQKGGAIFDLDKLKSINAWYIRNLPDKELLEKISHTDKRVTQSQQNLKNLAISKTRLHTLKDFWTDTKFLRTLPQYSDDLLIFKKSTNQTACQGLKAVLEALQSAEKKVWASEASLKKILENIVKDSHFSNGDIFWSARVALSGQQNSPQPSEIAWALGRTESLRRIEKALNKMKG